jgi:hypothetical protein
MKGNDRSPRAAAKTARRLNVRYRAAAPTVIGRDGRIPLKNSVIDRAPTP